MRIKNWGQFQHFKDRKPIWIKLYRSLLDDKDWNDPQSDDAKILIMLWLLASEDDGNLPDTAKISFRLRLPERSIISSISRLSHWVIQSDINIITSLDQDDISETETETETETELCVISEFAQFWMQYPRKIGKKAAEKAWGHAKDRPNLEVILMALDQAKRSAQWQKDGGQFIPHPATWINQGRWDDQPIRNDPSVMEAFLARGDHDDPLRLR